MMFFIMVTNTDESDKENKNDADDYDNDKENSESWCKTGLKML